MPRTNHRCIVLSPQSSALVLCLVLAACSSTPPKAPDTEPAARAAPAGRGDPCAMPQVTQRRAGGFYLDDGPGQNIPPNLGEVPDAVPRLEALRPANMRPYEALGRSYRPLTQLTPYKEQGIASWYGRRYHGQKTASGEVYDMYAMTAAHPILPIPSYARVTNLRNGRSVVVRINDRGPFHDGRVIDLSYTAACKLDVLAGGSTQVEVETIIPDATTTVAAAPKPRANATVPAPAAAPPAPSTAAATPAPAAAPVAGTPLEMDGMASPAAATAARPAPAEPAAVVPVSAESGGYFPAAGGLRLARECRQLRLPPPGPGKRRGTDPAGLCPRRAVPCAGGPLCVAGGRTHGGRPARREPRHQGDGDLPLVRDQRT